MLYSYNGLLQDYNSGTRINGKVRAVGTALTKLPSHFSTFTAEILQVVCTIVPTFFPPAPVQLPFHCSA